MFSAHFSVVGAVHSSNNHLTSKPRGIFKVKKFVAFKMQKFDSLKQQLLFPFVFNFTLPTFLFDKVVSFLPHYLPINLSLFVLLIEEEGEEQEEVRLFSPKIAKRFQNHPSQARSRRSPLQWKSLRLRVVENNKLTNRTPNVNTIFYLTHD